MPKTSETSAKHLQLNERFARRIPVILEEISLARIAVGPDIDEVAGTVSEMLDYLSFEIEKTELQIARNEWESRVSPDVIASQKSWLAYLKSIRDEFPIEKLTQSVTYLETLRERLDGLLNGEDANDSYVAA